MSVGRRLAPPTREARAASGGARLGLRLPRPACFARTFRRTRFMLAAVIGEALLDVHEFRFGLEERIDDVRVEMHAARFENNRLGQIVHLRVLIDAPRGERVVHVGQRHDPPAKRNFVTDQALRITAAVVSLVMRLHDLAGHPQEFGVGLHAGRRLERFRPEPHVQLHRLKFVVRQRTRLEQYRVRHAHLADVVQRARAIDEVDIVGVDLFVELRMLRQPLGEHPAVFADPLEVQRPSRHFAIRPAWRA